MKRTRMFLALAAVVSLGVAGSVGYACFMRSIQPVQVWLDHINVDITDQVAVKTYNCTFKNPNSQAVVGGTCYMELEPGAQVDNMSVTVDGKEMKAEILGVDKAKQVFTDIVKNGGSPALLEFFGNQLIQTQVPKIAPNGTVTVKLQYTTVLKKKGGLVRLQMLNTNPKTLMQTLKSASVTVNIKSKDPIKNIYSPTHEIDLVEKEGWDISAQWSQENYTPKHPFVLYYQTTEEQVGASVIAHRELDEEGSFMLMLSPTIGSGAGKITDEQILPKDVVFCVDTSGSMLKGKKMEQARAALKYCVETLRDGDRFNIVDFSTVARNFSETGLVEVNADSKAKALRYVEKLHARGGTAIEEALEKSLEDLGNGDRLKMIVFATDGLPTIGERNPQEILKTVTQKNTEDVRIFVFGEGFDVNTKLLDFLALNHRGEADYILPEEDIQEKISRFFDRVGSPVMTDLKVTIDGLEVKDMFPRKIPDVFRGEQVILYGRYNGHGDKTVKLTGNVNGKIQTLEFALTFPEYSEEDTSAFVPRLWAGQKVDFLLNEIRKSETPPQELVDEVTQLAKRYGIVTPYTSFLVTDDVASNEGGGVPGNKRGVAGGPVFQQRAELATKATDRLNADAAAKPGSSTPQLVEEAQRQAQLRLRVQKGQGGLAAFDEAVELESEANGKYRNSLQAVRYVSSRTFYQTNNTWYDSLYQPEKNRQPRVVEVGSEEYFKLLKQDSRIAKQLSLGDVVMQVGKEWVRIQTRRKS